VNAQQQVIGVGGDDQTSVTGQQSTPGETDTTVNAPPQVVLGTELIDEFCSGLNWTPACEPGQEEPEQVTGAMASHAFATVPLPPQSLIVQPPNGRTLVNFETNFYTDAPDVLPIISVPILDRVVELRVWPESFTWHFGDGRSVTTTERGAPYPVMGVTHEYQRKGQVAPSLDTTYAAQWRLQGQGAWQPVDGTVTIAGAPAQLDVLTATPQLVG
jgi:hypothetical protein